MKKVIVIRTNGTVAQWTTSQPRADIFHDIIDRYGEEVLSVTIIDIGSESFS